MNACGEVPIMKQRTVMSCLGADVYRCPRACLGRCLSRRLGLLLSFGVAALTQVGLPGLLRQSCLWSVQISSFEHQTSCSRRATNYVEGWGLALVDLASHCQFRKGFFKGLS